LLLFFKKEVLAYAFYFLSQHKANLKAKERPSFLKKRSKKLLQIESS